MDESIMDITTGGNVVKQTAATTAIGGSILGWWPVILAVPAAIYYLILIIEKITGMPLSEILSPRGAKIANKRRRIMELIKQRLRSKTYWLGVAIAATPLLEMITGPVTSINPVAGAVIGLAVIVLRELTREPLSAKTAGGNDK